MLLASLPVKDISCTATVLFRYSYYRPVKPCLIVFDSHIICIHDTYSVFQFLQITMYAWQEVELEKQSLSALLITEANLEKRRKQLMAKLPFDGDMDKSSTGMSNATSLNIRAPHDLFLRKGVPLVCSSSWEKPHHPSGWGK